MLLSVIIVNYNVKHFLEQCLCSLQQAMKGMNAEILVVDNNSTDGSMEYLVPRFPAVTFIQNKQNTGFAKANNQAAAVAKGDFILFLNPDTLLREDCLQSCIQFMDTHPDAGALGIQMIDGTGRFLPESKRAFPSPLTSLFKLMGLSAVFPHSRLFGRYHLGHLSNQENHVVDVLAGAFMLVRKEVLDKTGLFDEAFFMYGEDVDLSYRIQESGWKNYYFSGSSIIHFKGESTKKGSLNYVRMFYQAMSLFVQKHYGSGSARFFRFFIQIAIWLRAGLTALSSFLRWLGLPLFDILITLGCLAGMARVWHLFIKPGIQYPSEVIYLFLPLFTISFILAGAVTGLYDQSYRPRRAWIAMMAAVVINLAIYSLLNIDYRFSRGVILFGGLLASLSILLFRKILVDAEVITIQDENREYRQTLIVGAEKDFKDALQLMEHAGRNERVLGRIGLEANESGTIGSLQQLTVLLNELPAREIVFCIGEKLRMDQVIHFIEGEKRRYRYKFFYAGSDSIVGSDSKETTGEAFALTETFNLLRPENRRMKKVTDISWSLFLLLLSPIHLFFMKRPLGLFQNIAAVLARKKTWVGYCAGGIGLPPLPPGIICSNGHPAGRPQHLNAESLRTIDYWYAKDYEWPDDSRLLLKSYRNLGG
jgi:GT2 family glycosyltransferase